MAQEAMQAQVNIHLAIFFLFIYVSRHKLDRTISPDLEVNSSCNSMSMQAQVYIHLAIFFISIFLILSYRGQYLQIWNLLSIYLCISSLATQDYIP